MQLSLLNSSHLNIFHKNYMQRGINELFDAKSNGYFSNFIFLDVPSVLKMFSSSFWGPPAPGSRLPLHGLRAVFTRTRLCCRPSDSARGFRSPLCSCTFPGNPNRRVGLSSEFQFYNRIASSICISKITAK